MRDGSSKAKASKAVMQAMDRLYNKIPGFEDVFTETSFYIFAAVFAILAIVLGVIASRHIKLKDHDKEK